MPKEQPEQKTYKQWERELVGTPPQDLKMTKEEYLKLKKMEHTKLKNIVNALNKAGLWLTRNVRAGNVVGFEPDEAGETRFDKMGKRAMGARP